LLRHRHIITGEIISKLLNTLNVVEMLHDFEIYKPTSDIDIDILSGGRCSVAFMQLAVKPKFHLARQDTLSR